MKLISVLAFSLVSIWLGLIKCQQMYTAGNGNPHLEQYEYVPMRHVMEPPPFSFEEMDEEMDKSFNVGAAFVIICIGGLLPTIGAILLLYIENVINRATRRQVNLKSNKKLLSIVLNLSIGILICTIFVGLLPEGLENFQRSKWLGTIEEGHWRRAIGALVLIGWLVLLLAYRGLTRGKGHHHGHFQVTEDEGKDVMWSAERSAHFRQITRQMSVALFIHNIPEGIVIFITVFESYKLGLVFGIAMALHKLPEGVMLGAPAYYAYGSKWKAVVITFTATWIPQMLGGLIGWLSTTWDYDSLLTGILFLLATAILTQTLLSSLLPLATSYDPKDQYSTNFKLIGIIIYILLSSILD